MTDNTTPAGNRQYSDEEFLELIPEEEGEYVSTLTIARALGCTFQTVNRRVAQLAEHEGIEIYDPEESGLVTPETVEGSGRPVIGYGKALSDVLEEATPPDETPP